MKGGQEGGRTGEGEWNGWDVSIMAGSNVFVWNTFLDISECLKAKKKSPFSREWAPCTVHVGSKLSFHNHQALVAVNFVQVSG